MDIGISVLSNFYPPNGDEVSDGEDEFVRHVGSASASVPDSNGQGRGQPMKLPNQNSHTVFAAASSATLPSDLKYDECHVWQMPSADLSFAESHFAEYDSLEDNERLFKSLELGRGTSADFESSIESRHLHHSMDDISVNSQYRGKIPAASSIRSRDSRNGQFSRSKAAKEDEDDLDNMKTRFLSVWTNTVNGWVVKTKTDFKRDSAIWLLGQVYHCNKKGSTEQSKETGKKQKSNADEENTVFDKFKLDFKSRLWFTYRTNFPTLPSSHLKSDMGWGCMLRCGQMLLAQALLVHFLHRDWYWNPQDDERIHRRIIRYFGDAPHQLSPFSIHKLVEIGMNQQEKKPGDWYGPASIAHTLRQALKCAQKTDTQLKELSIYVAHDGVVYKQDVMDEYVTESTSSVEIATGAPLSSQSLSEPTTARERAIILIVPLRLGSDAVNRNYVPCLKVLLNNQLCIGLIGGKPKHSLYFIGWQDEKLIYLDPHCCQDFIDVTQQNFPLNTFHCGFPRKISFSKMDPSCAIGFYCRTQAELSQLLYEIPKVVSVPQDRHYPMFQVADGRYADVELSLGSTTVAHGVRPDEKKSIRNTCNKQDDFTFL